MKPTKTEKAMLKRLAKENRKRLTEIMEERDEETLTADGFDAGIVGITEASPLRVVYDYHTCVRVLMAVDGMSEEDALEHMNFNVTGSYVGDHTPVFIHSL
jgi:hypothetical protein